MRHHILFHVNNASHVVYDVVIDNTTKTFPLQYLFVANVNVLVSFLFLYIFKSDSDACIFFDIGRNIYFELISVSLYVELGERYNED